MATQAEFEAYCDAVSTAIAAGEYTTAKRKLAQARAILAALPIEVRSAHFAVRFRELTTNLENLKKEIDSLESAEAMDSVGFPVQRVKVKWGSPTA